MSRSGTRGRLARRSLVINSADLLWDAAANGDTCQLINALSEAALPTGLLGSLFGEDGELNSNLEALSLEMRTDWRRGRLSRSLIFEVTQRVRDARETPEEKEEEETETAEDVVGCLVSEVVDAAAEAAEADQRERVLRGLLGRYVPSPLLESKEVQQIGDCVVSAHQTLVSGAQRMQAAWRMILASSAAQLMLSFSRILSRQQERLTAELLALGLEDHHRDLLNDPGHGLLAILLERRRLVTAILDPQDDQRDYCSALPTNVVGSTMTLCEPSLEQSVLQRTNGQRLRRRRASEPGLFMTDVTCEKDDDLSKQADRRVRGAAHAAALEMRQVTERILELTVTYLKNAALDVIDSSVEEVKSLLGTRL